MYVPAEVTSVRLDKVNDILSIVAGHRILQSTILS